jgi:hypothetical protein
MSKNNKASDVLLKEERYKLFPYVIALFAITLLINSGLWMLDTFVILSFVIILVASKLISIAFRLINYEKWKSRRFSFLLVFTFILIVSFVFDFQTIRDLWIYRFGAETQGHVSKFVKTREVLVVYDFSVNGVSFQGLQGVSNSFYERLSVGSPVSIKYYQNNPNVSYLVDLENQKLLTGFTFLIGLCVMAAMFANEIQEKVKSLFNRVFVQRNPPNKACTRTPAAYAGAMVVGVCAFSGSFPGLKWVPSKWRYLLPPTSG